MMLQPPCPGSAEGKGARDTVIKHHTDRPYVCASINLFGVRRGRVVRAVLGGSGEEGEEGRQSGTHTDRKDWKFEKNLNLYACLQQGKVYKTRPGEGSKRGDICSVFIFNSGLNRRVADVK